MVKLTKEQKVALSVGVAAVGGYVAYKYLKPSVAICTPGDEKCIGLNWCRCNPEGTKWDVIVPNDEVRCPIIPGTAILYGTVTDKTTGSPIEGISVNCDSYPGTTALDGTYRIENIPPGAYTVTFTDPLGRYEEKVM